MGRKSTKKLYQFVDALVATGAREMIKAGLTKDELQAREVSREIAQAICYQYARTIMYVPADLEFQLSQRDQVIWEKYGQDGADGARKFTPMRVAQLSEEFSLTVAHIYCIARAVMKREQESRQGRLPGLEDEPAKAPG